MTIPVLVMECFTLKCFTIKNSEALFNIPTCNATNISSPLCCLVALNLRILYGYVSNEIVVNVHFSCP